MRFRIVYFERNYGNVGFSKKKKIENKNNQNDVAMRYFGKISSIFVVMLELLVKKLRSGLCVI